MEFERGRLIEAYLALCWVWIIALVRVCWRFPAITHVEYVEDGFSRRDKRAS